MKDNLLKSRICDKTTLHKWLETEKVLYLGNDIKTQVKKILLYDHDYMLWKFVRALRICEYHYNARGVGHKLLYVLWQNRKNHIGEKLGLTAWHNTIDLGVRFWHYGSVIVNGHAKIGKNCQFHGNNCVGNKGVLDEAAPRLGDNVEIGVGAKIIGDIHIADGVKIGANAVVVKSCYNKGATLVGIPALEVRK